MKTLVSSDGTLQYYDVNAPAILQVDASLKGLGAALLQPDESGNERPIAYASKALTDCETRYANIERELLAVCFGVDRFKTYLYGRRFKIITDHKPLIMILQKNLIQAPPRLQRMMLRLQGYDFEIVYRPGKEMILPDSLSRLPNPSNRDQIDLDMRVDMIHFSPNKLSAIATESIADPTLSQLTEIIIAGWPDTMKEVPTQLREYWSFRDELSVENGLILKGERTIIPHNQRSTILEKLHTGHMGMTKTKLRAKNLVYWININADIEKMCKDCMICQEHKPTQQHETLLQHEVPTGPWETVATDLFELDQKHYLVIVDYYSKYPIVKQVPDRCPSSTVISITKQVFAEHGIPKKVISDNGPHYSSYQYKQFAEDWEFQHVTSSPKYPRSNGFVERQIRTIKDILKKTKKGKEDPDLSLLYLRTTPINDKLPSPAEILFRRKLRCNIPMTTRNCNNDRDEISEQLKKRQADQKFYHDRSAKDLPPPPYNQVRR